MTKLRLRGRLRHLLKISRLVSCGAGVCSRAVLALEPTPRSLMVSFAFDPGDTFFLTFHILLNLQNVSSLPLCTLCFLLCVLGKEPDWGKKALARPQYCPSLPGPCPAHWPPSQGGVPAGRLLPALPLIACVCRELPWPSESSHCPPVHSSGRDDLSPVLGTKRQPAM